MTWDRHAIAAARDRASLVWRPWQRQALHRATTPDARSNGIITAIMGAGKSVVVACLCAAWQGPVVVSAPSIALVEQLSGTIARVTGELVGRWYTHAKDLQRITCVCVDSLDQLPPIAGPILWIADECHRTERDVVASFIATHTPAHAIGLSATPYQADDGTLSLWTHEIIRYEVADALRDGVLVPMRVDYLTGRPGEQILVDDACIAWIRQADGPGIASARDIADAEDFAEQLRDAGIPALSVHSRMRRKAIADALRDLQSGTIRVIVHCRMLVEGVDLPWLRWLCLRHPRGSRVAFSQEIGRVLRSHPGKDHARVYDPYGVTLEHQLQDAAAVCEAVGTPASKTAATAEPPEPLIDPLTGEIIERPTVRDERTVRARSDASAYIARALITLRQTGAAKAEPDAQPGLKGWRRDPASAKQLDVLYRAESQCRLFVQRKGEIDGLTGDAAAHLRYISLCATRAAAASRTHDVRKGPISDLITVLFCAVRTSPETRAKALASLVAAELEIPE